MSGLSSKWRNMKPEINKRVFFPGRGKGTVKEISCSMPHHAYVLFESEKHMDAPRIVDFLQLQETI